MKNIFILFSALTLFSCQKVIDIHPATGEVKVIIEAYLFTDSTAYAVVTKSTDYLTDTPPPHISTAVVTLSDDNGNTEILTWNNTSQRYESVAMKGVVNRMYTLKVDLEGKSYSATSTLLYLDRVDSITVVKENTNIRPEGYYMKLYGTIPTSVDKYYFFKGYSGDSLLDDPNDINYADNTMVSGKLDGIDMGYKCDSLEVAKLKIFSLTLPANKFYAAAYLQLNNDGGFFSTPPANVPSMFNNDAVGLFQCSDIQVLTRYVDLQ